MISRKNISKAKKIKILLMDVDGVLTDGKMYYLPDQKGKMVEFKAFHSLDGIGLRLLNQFGILTGVITGRQSPCTKYRARELGMDYAYQGFLSKLAPMAEILKDTGLKEENVAYIGDDLTDIPVLKKAGLACAPGNALDEVKKVCDLITLKKGGGGAVREVCDFILKSQGRWKTVMDHVETSHWPQLPKAPLKVVLYSNKSPLKRGSVSGSGSMPEKRTTKGSLAPLVEHRALP